MASVFIDYDDVGLKGLEGMQRVLPEDTLRFFYTDKSELLPMKKCMEIRELEATVIPEPIELTEGSEHGFEYRFAATLGEAVGQNPEEKYLVVSDKRNYKEMFEYFDKQDIFVKNSPDILSGIDLVHDSDEEYEEPAEEPVEEDLGPEPEIEPEPVEEEPEPEPAEEEPEPEPAEEEPEPEPVEEEPEQSEDPYYDPFGDGSEEYNVEDTEPGDDVVADDADDNVETRTVDTNVAMNGEVNDDNTYSAFEYVDETGNNVNSDYKKVVGSGAVEDAPAEEEVDEPVEPQIIRKRIKAPKFTGMLQFLQAQKMTQIVESSTSLDEVKQKLVEEYGNQKAERLFGTVYKKIEHLYD